jgi:hypothetical protein
VFETVGEFLDLLSGQSASQDQLSSIHSVSNVITNLESIYSKPSDNSAGILVPFVK